jgi:Flp pilus assembly protein TadG
MTRRRSRSAANRAGSRSRARSRGQALVEFSLTFPLFLTLMVGILEYGFIFNAFLSINFATRDAALIGAEAGNASGADCVILKKIEDDIGAPADKTRITEVRIYESSVTGSDPMNPATPVDLYTRTGSTTCTLPDSTTVTVPYTISGSKGYPEANRCNVLSGCGSGQPLDYLGIQVTYVHLYRTPLGKLVGGSGSGFTLVQSNAMRMEPVL